MGGRDGGEAGRFAGPTSAGEMFRAVAAFYEEVAVQTEGYSAALSTFLGPTLGLKLDPKLLWPPVAPGWDSVA